MVYILKKNNNHSKGVAAFNMNEKDFFQKKFAQFFYKIELELLKKKYFLLMHWSWYGNKENDIPFIDYHLAGKTTLSFNNPKKNKIVDFCNRNFIDKIFQEKKITKIYDIISILRPVHWKNLKQLFIAANKIYKKKINLSFLVIIPMPNDKDFYGSKKSYTELMADYNYYIDKNYRKYFTILPINTFNYKYSLTKEQICNFLNLSKIFILPVKKEGASRVIHEALLCNVPVIYYKKLKGGGADYLDKKNSLYYKSENEIYKKIIYSVKNYKKFKINKKKTKNLMSEEYQVPKFKKFLDKIYQEANEKFDGRIDLSELDRKLDSHKISLKKSLRKPNSNHIKNFSAFYKYICFLLEKRPSTIKLILINIFENLFYIMRYLKYEIYFKIKKFLL